MIFPKYFPGNIHDISHEHALYKRFQKEINPSENVYYSLTLITPDVPIREIDFVVVSPYGILTVELKNGKWRYSKGKWEFYNARMKEWQEVEGKSYSGPTEQANTQIQFLKEFLKNHNRLEDVFPEEYYDSAVFFLKNNASDFHLKQKTSPYIFGKEELDDENVSLQQIVNQIQDRENRPPLSEDLIQKVHSILSKNLNSFTSLRPSRRKNEEDLLLLTKEQFQFIEGAKSEKKSLVYGVSGSGKSILAGELALQLSSQGRKVLLWQGSFPLYQLWKESLESMELTNSPLLIHHLEESKDLKFDVIIADQTEEWIASHSLEDLFLSLSDLFWKESDWIFFLNRNLKFSNSPILKYLESIPHKSWDILRNIRNSPEISKFANLLYENHGGESALENLTDVQLIEIGKEDSLSEKIKWCFGYAKKILHIESHEIVVIHPEGDFLSRNKELTDLLEEYEIRFSTVQKFNGMEETCGILVGFENWKQSEVRLQIAEACLFFRSLVCVFYPEEEEENIRYLLNKNGSGP